MKAIIELPECILLLLQEYISYEEYRNIFNTCNNTYIQDVKKRTMIYSLSKEWSKEYFVNKSFRNRVLSLIYDYRKQLSISLFLGDKDDIAHLQKEFAIYDGFQDITIGGSNRTNIGLSLHYFSAANTLRIDSVPVGQDFRALKHIVKLVLNSIKYDMDISSLEFCPSLTIVELLRCSEMIDINALWKIKERKLYDCMRLSDGSISKFSEGNLEKLDISMRSRITCIDHIHSLKSFRSRHYDGIRSIKGLLFLKHLSLRNSPQISQSFHYDNLPSLETVSIRGWQDIPLDYVNSLNIKVLDAGMKGTEIKDLSVFRHLRSVQLLCLTRDSQTCNVSRCHTNSLSQVSSLKVLSLRSFYHPKFNIHLFQQLSVLRLFREHCFEGITEPMPNLRELVLYDCVSIRTISGLYRKPGETNERRMRVTLDSCPSFIFNSSFYRFVMNDVLRFTYSCRLKPQIDRADGEGEQGMEEQQQLTRDKTITFLYFRSDYFPFSEKQLTNIFSRTRVLVLYHQQASNPGHHRHDLSAFQEMNIHKIPVLMIEGSPIQHLYSIPMRIVPEHEWIVLISCRMFNLLNIGSAVTRLSISECGNIDLRPLINTNCRSVEYRLTSFETPVLPPGYKEISSRIQPFRLPEELKRVGDMLTWSSGYLSWDEDWPH